MACDQLTGNGLLLGMAKSNGRIQKVCQNTCETTEVETSAATYSIHNHLRPDCHHTKVDTDEVVVCK
jgi:hypothetical protein